MKRIIYVFVIFLLTSCMTNVSNSPEKKDTSTDETEKKYVVLEPIKVKDLISGTHIGGMPKKELLNYYQVRTDRTISPDRLRKGPGSGGSFFMGDICPTEWGRTGKRDYFLCIKGLNHPLDESKNLMIYYQLQRYKDKNGKSQRSKSLGMVAIWPKWPKNASLLQAAETLGLEIQDLHYISGSLGWLFSTNKPDVYIGAWVDTESNTLVPHTLIWKDERFTNVTKEFRYTYELELDCNNETSVKFKLRCYQNKKYAQDMGGVKYTGSIPQKPVKAKKTEPKYIDLDIYLIDKSFDSLLYTYKSLVNDYRESVTKHFRGNTRSYKKDRIMGDKKILNTANVVSKELAKRIKPKIEEAKTQNRIASVIGWSSLLDKVERDITATKGDYFEYKSSSFKRVETPLSKQTSVLANDWLSTFTPKLKSKDKSLLSVGQPKNTEKHFARYLRIFELVKDLDYPQWNQTNAGHIPTLYVDSTQNSSLNLKKQFFKQKVRDFQGFEQYTESRNPRLEEYIKEKIAKLESEVSHMQSNKLPPGKSKKGNTGGQRYERKLQIQKDGQTRYKTFTSSDGLFERARPDLYTQSEIDAKNAELSKERRSLNAVLKSNQSTKTRMVYKDKQVAMERQIWTGKVKRNFTLRSNNLSTTYTQLYDIEKEVIEDIRGSYLLPTIQTKPALLEKQELNHPNIIGLAIAQSIHGFAEQQAKVSAESTQMSKSALDEELMWTDILLSVDSNAPEVYRYFFDIKPAGYTQLKVKHDIVYESYRQILKESDRRLKERPTVWDIVETLGKEGKVLLKRSNQISKKSGTILDSYKFPEEYVKVSYLYEPIKPKLVKPKVVKPVYAKRKKQDSKVPEVFWLANCDAQTGKARINMGRDAGYNKFVKFENYFDEKWELSKVEESSSVLSYKKSCHSSEKLVGGMLFFKK